MEAVPRQKSADNGLLLHTKNFIDVVKSRRFDDLKAPIQAGAHVATDLFEAHQEMLHLSLPEQADAILIAPATANCLAKAALGLADDLLSTMLLTTQCPLIFAPAMDGDMWRHPTSASEPALSGIDSRLWSR